MRRCPVVQLVSSSCQKAHVHLQATLARLPASDSDFRMRGDCMRIAARRISRDARGLGESATIFLHRIAKQPQYRCSPVGDNLRITPKLGERTVHARRTLSVPVLAEHCSMAGRSRGAQVSAPLAVKRRPIPTNVVEVPLDGGDLSFPHELDGLITPEEYDRDIVNGLTVPGRIELAPQRRWCCMGRVLPSLVLVVGACLAIVGAVRSASTTQNVGIALLCLAGFALVGCLVLTKVARRRRIDTIAAQMEMQIAVLNPRFRERGISFNLYSEIGTALMRWERGSSVSVQERPLSIRARRITLPRPVRARTDWLTHGCILQPSPASDGGAQMAPTNRIVTEAYGQMEVPESCVPTAGCDFVLVAWPDFQSPVNGSSVGERSGPAAHAIDVSSAGSSLVNADSAVAAPLLRAAASSTHADRSVE